MYVGNSMVPTIPYIPYHTIHTILGGFSLKNKRRKIHLRKKKCRANINITYQLSTIVPPSQELRDSTLLVSIIAAAPK